MHDKELPVKFLTGEAHPGRPGLRHEHIHERLAVTDEFLTRHRKRCRNPVEFFRYGVNNIAGDIRDRLLSCNADSRVFPHQITSL